MTILLIVAGILLSSVPVVLAYIRFRNLKDEVAYKDLMTKAMIVGLLSCPAGFLLSGVFAIIERVFHINEMGLLGAAYHKIILLALAEEIVKTFLFIRFTKKHSYPYSWLDLIAIGTTVAIGFEIGESMVMLGSEPIVMLLRGISAMHMCFGFVIAWGYGKYQKTGKILPFVLCFLLSWLWHGLYDFGLSEELLALNDNFAALSISLAVISFAYMIYIFIFITKAAKKEVYTTPIIR